MNYTCIDLGISDYNQAYIFQKQCVADVKSKYAEGFLIFTEHNPVFTLGRSYKGGGFLIAPDTLRFFCIDAVDTDRGGDITFHGPGQLVAYPIIDLNAHYRDIHRFLRELEEVIIMALKEFDINAFRSEGRTGVWVKGGKLASIGIGISNWVTYHGLAINTNIDLSYFDMINPCGLKDIRATSMKEVLGEEIRPELLKNRLINQFCNRFSCSITLGKYSDILV